jgi:amino acid adenylation domain-containing protein
VVQLNPIPPPPPASPQVEPPSMMFPCSLAQERFWVLDQLDPGNTALNVAVRWRLEGVVDSATMERAVRQVIDRHEVLRTGFVEADGAPRQHVRPSVAFRLAVSDLTRLPEAERTHELLRLGTAEAHASFDLALAPLLRVRLVQLTPVQSILLVTAHHIVCDGWSVGILARDIGRCYQALRAGVPADLPDLPLQYGDYALWQRAWLDSDALDDARVFWRDLLHGAKYFELPTDRPRPPLQTANGAILSLLQPREVTDRVDQFGRRHGATLFMTALTCLVTMLQRYTGESDISVGTQVAGRDQVELEDMVGLFINTIVLRLDAAGDPTAAGLLERVRDTVRAALGHEAMPIEQLITLLKPERDLSRNALFSVNFIFQRSFITNASYGEYALVDIPSQSAGALYDLNFFMVERPEGWRTSCEYNTDLFDAGSVEAMLSCWGSVLANLPAEADRPLSRVSLLAPEVRRSLLKVDVSPRPDDQPSGIFPQDFAAQAARTPNEVAVVAANGQLTYRALDEASNRLAHRLRKQGIGVGSLVGIGVDRTTELLVTLLGVLKSGAAYVPLDPAYPRARLQQMIGDAGLALLLGDAASLALLPAGGTPVLDVGAAETFAAEPSSALPEIAGPDDVAYVIYTSGTTGRPKGVQIPHRALTNLLWSMRESPGLEARDTLVAVTTLSFDIAALELFLPLLVGARLVVARREEAADGHALDGLLRRSGATVMQATPMTWQLLVEAGWDQKLRMMCGGEALPRKLADQLLARGGTLWNMYGPTETTIWSCVGEVASDGPVMIGPPIANTYLYILNHELELTPPGAIGELFIGGVGIAKGYLNRPDLTAERFLADPFRDGVRQDAPGARMYRTGDLVRRRADGRIEFHGRTDHQVKLRGFRIELGEVEAALLAHAGAAAAAAVVRNDGSGPGLYGYVVATAAYAARQDELVLELRRELATRLPPQMQPTSITVLAALPRTNNGKIDRAALPAPAAPLTASIGVTAIPVDSARERMLQGIWSEVLGLPSVAPGDNFFEIGGHSLLAARMLARVEVAFGERLRLAMLFRAPTLRQFAALLPDRREPEAPTIESNPSEIEVIPVQPEGSRRTIFAINNSGVFHALSQRLGADQPFVSVQLIDVDQPRQLADLSMEQIAANYLALIRTQQPHGPYILLGWCNAGIIAYEIAQQLRAAGEEVRLLAIIEAWAPGHSRRLPWLRRQLTDLAYSYHWHASELSSGKTSLLAMLLNNRLMRRTGLPRLFSGLRNYQAMTTEDPYAWFVRYLDQRIERYEPKPYDGATLLLYCSEQPTSRFLDRHFGWTALLRGTMTLRKVTGGHRSMFNEPAVAEMASCINAELDREVA